MTQHGRVRARRMRALGDLRELVRVAEENKPLRGRADGDRVGKRNLATLVHEQRVHIARELLASEEERRASDQLQLRIAQVGVVSGAVDEPAFELRSRPARFLRPRNA